MKDLNKLDRYFYSIELNENNEKVMHLLGNAYFNDADGTDKPYRLAEWTWMYFSLDKLKEKFDHDILFDVDSFYEYINERVNYLGDHTENEIIEICNNYFDGESGNEMHPIEINEELPCGNYWW